MVAGPASGLGQHGFEQGRAARHHRGVRRQALAFGGQHHAVGAVIGQQLVVARKDRYSGNWFVGGATDETPREVTLRLDFLEPGVTYKAVIYRDGEGADYKTNPYPLAIDQRWVGSHDKLTIRMASSGGFAIMLQKEG